MQPTANHECLPVGEPSRPAARIVPWLKLGLGIAAILFVMFGIGPSVLQLPWYGEMNRFIESENIRATAIYYTDLDTFRDAEFALRLSLEYGPTARPIHP